MVGRCVDVVVGSGNEKNRFLSAFFKSFLWSSPVFVVLGVDAVVVVGGRSVDGATKSPNSS